jgi:predicted nucleic acid-binding protein
MTSVYLIDTNLLIYTHDRRESKKQARAVALLMELEAREAGALSTQVLGEFLAVAARKLGDRFSQNDLRDRVAWLGAAFPVLEITLPIVLEAARATAEHQMSYWDAQVWATAKLNQIPFVLSEDLQGWESLEGVRFLNSFAGGFSLPTSVRR